MGKRMKAIWEETYIFLQWPENGRERLWHEKCAVAGRALPMITTSKKKTIMCQSPKCSVKEKIWISLTS